MDAYATLVHGLDNVVRGVYQEPGGPSSEVPSLLGIALDNVFRSEKISKGGDLYEAMTDISDDMPLSKAGGYADLAEIIRNEAIKIPEERYKVGSDSPTAPSDNTAVYTNKSVEK